MKKAVVLLLTAAIFIGCAGVYAAGGSDADPLISLLYLEQEYIPAAVEQAGQRVYEQTEQVYQSVLAGLEQTHGGYLARLGGGAEDVEESAAMLDQRYKYGDVLRLPVGAAVMPLAGELVVSDLSGGVLIDVTAGQTVAAGTVLTAQHRYIAGEDTLAAISVTSDTAVASTEGTFTVSRSASTDYNALADALKAMGLFKGSDIAYGSGYNLEAAPTRMEGLIMFLRLLGEEDDALAYTGENPFSDVPAWCERYAAYAYAKGYTIGIGTGADGRMKFGTGNTISARDYVTFLLRALGYSDSGAAPDFHWAEAVERGVALGVLNAAEGRCLTEKPFLRAQVVYVSYFAMDARRKSGGTLLSALTAAGALDAALVESVRSAVYVPRMG